ncbi:MaoC family dehydratase [Erythrobacter ramosus]|uniref:MaoC family dehydratase n=1 Tax=Erythrobacter ramosus TaxID=35811 RepID=UPI0031DCAAFC
MLEVSISRQDLVRYAGVADDYLPRHWDQAMMQEQGFPDVVVHGWLGTAHLLRAVGQVLSPDEWSLSQYSVRYRRPLYPGMVTCEGEVIAAEPGIRRVSARMLDCDRNVATTAELLYGARTVTNAV